MKNRTFFSVIKFLVIFIGYVITGKLGLEIGAVSEFATLVWFPAGLSLASLLLFGYRFWPAVFLGAFCVNLLTGASFPVALGISVGNTSEALMGIFLLKKLHFNPFLQRLRDVVTLIVVGSLVAALGATMGVGSLLLTHMVPVLVETWIAWWIGDMVSIFVVTPLLLTWFSNYTFAIRSFARSLEAIVLMALAIGAAVFVFSHSLPVTYLVFPPVIWAALRFGPRETTSSVFVISSIAVIYTYFGFGPFVRQNLSESLIYLQSFMSVMTVTSLILAAAVAESKSLERRKNEFVSMASHELKTPLTSMKIYLHILRKIIQKSNDQRAVRVLSNIDGKVDKLGDLVSDLLDISLIQVHRLQLKRSTFSISELIQEVVEGMQSTTKRHTLFYPDTSTYLVQADNFRIMQVLTNLLSNAIKYSPQGGDIIIRAIKRKNKVIVSVQDFGIGISSEQQEKVFEKLYQASYHEEKTFPGLGVGLYISSQIMKQHNEKLWVESELGKGSTFYFSLPLGKSVKRKA